MNATINKEVKNLIQHIFKDKRDPDILNSKEKQVLAQLKKGDTMSFVNKKQMDSSIEKMAEKFQFHGFFPQAEHLRKMYNKFMSKATNLDIMTCLNTMRFLLCMSDSPTSKFLEHPEKYTIEDEEDDKKVINWGEYLLEGIKVYTPEEVDDSYEDSDAYESANENGPEYQKEEIHKVIEAPSNVGLKIDYHLSRQELMSAIQHTWYNAENFLDKPFSQAHEANVGILWEKYLSEETYGLLNLDKTSFISEYKVIREIIWQMFKTHKSFVFTFDGNYLKLRKNISIPSVRSISFEAFVKQFLEYIELLSFFRNFMMSFKEYEPCQTYICYAMGIQRNIIDPIYEKLIEIEEKVRIQNDTYTLLKLGEDLMPIFEPLKILRDIHHEVTVPVDEHSALYCSTALLSRLHASLNHSITKLEHDIKLTLYLESLYKYFFLIDSWLTRNDFVDTDAEFVLIQVNCTHSVEYKTTPFLSSRITYEINNLIKEEFKNDSIIQIICNRVLQIAKNFRLLFLLRKFDFYTKGTETLHQELIRRFLEELSKCFKCKDDDVSQNVSENEITEAFKYPVISSDSCKKATDMDKLENLVDTNNSFLMEAFADFFFEKPKEDKSPKNITLYDRISKITTGLIQVRNSIEKIFLDMLKERFSVSGLMVKSALIEDHHLDQFFEFLRALFLFCNAKIISFFEQLFEEMKYLSNKPWRYMKLSSNLKDTLSENYPMICNKCEITLNSTMEQCNDPLNICDNLNIIVDMNWPLNIVVRMQEMKVYKKLFHFFIKLKWALHSLNGLSCKDLFNIELKKASQFIKNTVRKLEVFRFSLLHLLNFIDHYVVTFCLMKCLKQFELDFEKSNDLDSVIKSHCDFVEGVTNMVEFLNESNDQYNFNMVLHCVKVLINVWSNLDLAVDKKVLDATFHLYKKCYTNIETKINKMYLINYY